jgi:integrase
MLAALLFLYRDVLKIQLQRIDDIERARLPARLPVVLTKREVQALLKQLSGIHLNIGGLMYGAGLRLMECLLMRSPASFPRPVASGPGNTSFLRANSPEIRVLTN